ncbi:MAG: BCCT family transporter, partial [Proteobacteria bacterium]|nr:BCCT family transporter [Pseudomonadota bacterium]
VLGVPRVPAIIVGGTIVVIYSVLGGMWSITLTDILQFGIMTVGIFGLLLPISLSRAGGWSGMQETLPASYFDITAIGGGTILTYFLIYFFGIIIGQDIWQRVFTARDGKVARRGGLFAGVYCLLYALAGAVAASFYNTALLFVLVAGPTVFLLQTLVQNTGMYLSNLFAMTFNLYAYQPTGWIGGWTLFYWGWWIAWSPFVGMFIARVSRGRTIREFVVGVLLVPLGFTFLWMTFFGDTAIHMVLIQGIGGLADAVEADSSVALFRFFEELPLAGITSLLATILVITFFVTSSDSGSLVIDLLTSGAAEDSPLWQRVFWSVLEGVVAAALLVAGGLGALQTASIASALPFSIVMVVICWGLLRALRIEGLKRLSLRDARVEPRGPHAALDLQRRVAALLHQPRQAEVLGYIRDTVLPALTEVAEEMRKGGLDVAVEAPDDGRAWLEVRHGDEVDFYYSVRPRPYEAPAFVLRDTGARRAEQLKHYRAEVHLREGGRDYDIMGWRREHVINDVLDHYQRHLHFLNAVR